MTSSAPRSARHLWLLSVLVTVLSLTFAGCGGGGGDTGSGGGNTFPASLPNYHAPSEWIALLEAAGLQEYADLGNQLIRDGKVKVVMPPTLDAQFNAFSWITDREIWINAPMFSRYPNAGLQATIFLHEMIHIKSGESSHAGPWWAVQDQFAAYCQSRTQNP